MTARTNDTLLLQRFAPVIRYTRGERFFPMDIERFVKAAGLWQERQGKRPQCVISPRRLTLADLSAPPPTPPQTVTYLKITDHAENLAAGDTSVSPPEPFHSGLGRLARVGYLSRMMDTIFAVGLLTRGRVKGENAQRAAEIYSRQQAQSEKYQYYGRVVREKNWVVLQYWYFYMFNNWRTLYHGGNDHEGDWEMVAVYLSHHPQKGLQPEWVGYASHLDKGDNRRRHWTDPDVEKVGLHPVVYAGAGSHSAQYKPGEYVMEMALPFLAPFSRIVNRLKRVWYERLRQYGAVSSEPSEQNMFRIPFIDYARGDGLSIGVRQEKNWEKPVVISDETPWVSKYRGLWGDYANDPFSEENAPAGPRYYRDGTVRLAWYDPLGWAGLDKVVPEHLEASKMEQEIQRIEARVTRLKKRIREQEDELQTREVSYLTAQVQAHLRQIIKPLATDIRQRHQKLAKLKKRLSMTELLLDTLREKFQKSSKGQRITGIRDHLGKVPEPATTEELQLNKVVEVWSAVSIGLLLIGFVLVWGFVDEYLWYWAALLVSVFIFIEYLFRNRLTQLVSLVGVWLSIISLVVLLYEFFSWLVVGAVLLTGLYMIWQNIREVWR